MLSLCLKANDRVTTFGSNYKICKQIFELWSHSEGLLRKEVIQPLVLERLPCYDFTPIIEPTFDRALHNWLGYGLRVFPTLMV